MRPETREKWRAVDRQRAKTPQKKAQVARWKRLNRERVRAHNAARYARKTQAQPKWADLKAIEQFYIDTQADLQVDHIYPLRADWVCGLHTLENLQRLPAHENQSKSNKKHPQFHREIHVNHLRYRHVVGLIKTAP